MLKKIISGGQTGADRGALDAALALGFECGGWCPRRRRAEDGAIPARYPLQEAPSARYPVRTRRNIEESDGTLIVARGALSGGTLVTARHAERLGKPCLTLDPDGQPPGEMCRAAGAWLTDEGIEILNVAGPRRSSDPDIYRAVRNLVAGLIVSSRRRS